MQLSRSDKNFSKNPCIRIVIGITIKVQSAVASHIPHPSREFHQNSSTTVRVSQSTVQLPYPGNLLNLKIHRFIRKQLFVILINKVQQ